MRDYFHDEMGNPEIFLGAKTDIVVDGKIQVQPTAHIFAEYFGGNIFLPGKPLLPARAGIIANTVFSFITTVPPTADTPPTVPRRSKHRRRWGKRPPSCSGLSLF